MASEKSWPPMATSWPCARGALDQRAQAAVGHGGFDEDRADAALHEEAHQLLDAGDAGLGLGRDALDALHVEAVGAAEVAEGVVGGDEDAGLLGHGGQHLVGVGAQGASSAC
jgi:hypothetical protein